MTAIATPPVTPRVLLMQFAMRLRERTTRAVHMPAVPAEHPATVTVGEVRAMIRLADLVACADESRLSEFAALICIPKLHGQIEQPCDLCENRVRALLAHLASEATCA